MSWIFKFCFSLYFFIQDCIMSSITWKVWDLISRETSFVWMIMCKSVVTDVRYTMNSKKVIFRTAVHKESSEIIHTFYFLNKALQYLTFSWQWVGKIQTSIKDAFSFLTIPNIWEENNRRKYVKYTVLIVQQWKCTILLSVILCWHYLIQHYIVYWVFELIGYALFIC